MKIPIRCTYKKLMDPASLKPNPKNPNKHPDRQLDIYGQVVRLQGWRRAIVVSNLSGLIVMGHGAREVGLRLKCKVPVDFQDFATEEEEHAQMLADHRIPELSEFDAGSALELLGELDPAKYDLAGYSPESFQELEAMAEEQAQASETERDRLDVKLKPVKVKGPPKMAWVLIGIPLVRFSEINSDVERIAGVEGTVVESSVNDVGADNGKL